MCSKYYYLGAWYQLDFKISLPKVLMLTLMIFRNTITLMNSSGKCFRVAHTVLCLGPQRETQNFTAPSTVCLLVITSRLLLWALAACSYWEAPTSSEICFCFWVAFVSDWNHHLHMCPRQKPKQYLVFPTASSSPCAQHPLSRSVTIQSKYPLLICLWDFPSPHSLHLYKANPMRIISSLLKTCFTLLGTLL